ncbi:EAL and HDOD domain-containing protein [Thiomicrorhabdus sp. Kp2]|uniref:EAL and HDOD domain-containing protein n=1 Tax=Thiomicrorhabdus sp. Kp2 TaxID=1123518 RepID=UPI00040B4FB1|nr:HDOD domain-containing protein [Thiomicrorhabdus sp. Kp2]
MQAQLFLNKQPILDAKQVLYGYHLSLELVNDVDPSKVEWESVMKAFCEDIAKQDGMSALTSNKPIFYRAPIEVLTLDWLPKVDDLSMVTVEVTLANLRDKTVVASLKEVIKAGARVAVLGYENSDAYKKLLTIAKTVKLDAKEFSAEEAKTIVSALNLQQVNSVICGLETEEEFAEYAQAKATFYQGYFFTNPVISGQKELSGSKLAMLKLLAEVNDPDVEFDKIVQTVGSDVGLTHKLLSAINHPNNNIPQVIETLKDAVNFMGLKRLKFWVNMMVLSEANDVPKELLTTALVRAKFMEVLAEKQGKTTDKDRYFMTGMFSTLNAFLKASMVDIVGQLPLSSEVKVALVDHSGDMGKALFVVRSLEQGNANMGGSGIDIMLVSSAYMSANSWAYKTMNGLEAA